MSRFRHEMAVCKCGSEFSRAMLKKNRKKLCERCSANRNYQLRKRGEK
jgi:hypothetical protein